MLLPDFPIQPKFHPFHAPCGSTWCFSNLGSVAGTLHCHGHSSRFPLHRHTANSDWNCNLALLTQARAASFSFLHFPPTVRFASSGASQENVRITRGLSRHCGAHPDLLHQDPVSAPHDISPSSSHVSPVILHISPPLLHRGYIVALVLALVRVLAPRGPCIPNSTRHKRICPRFRRERREGHPPRVVCSRPYHGSLICYVAHKGSLHLLSL